MNYYNLRKNTNIKIKALNESCNRKIEISFNEIYTEVLWPKPTLSAKFPRNVPRDESGPFLNLNPTVEQ